MQNPVQIITEACNQIVKEDSEMLKWRFGVTNEELSHIASIASSIVMHKHQIRSGGGFVEAVCSDSLIKASGRADSTMQKVLAYMATFAERADYIYKD